MVERENMVKSVSRALDIITLISLKKNGLGVTEIANQIDINKSSVYRILSTLVQYGYIEQDSETGKYKLGYKFLEISSKPPNQSICVQKQGHFCRSLKMKQMKLFI